MILKLQFTTWIYNSECNVPSSSNVESYFKTIKRYLCDIATKSQRLRVDDFLKKHEEYLAGELKSAIVKEKRKEIKTKTERTTKTITKKESVQG